MTFFCIRTRLWPVAHLETHCKHKHPLKKEQDGQKSWVRPEGKSFHACTTITLLFSLPPGVFNSAQDGICWSVSRRDIGTFLTGWRRLKYFPWIKINTLEGEKELSAHSLTAVVDWKAIQTSF